MEPYVGQIIAVGFNFAPTGWHLCDGGLLPINQNQALFSLLGTAFGGDGRTTFAVPDLRGRVVVGQGQLTGGGSYTTGGSGGTETVTLTAAQAILLHSHTIQASAKAAAASAPDGAVFGAGAAGHNIYGGGTPVAMSPNAIAASGGGASHENRQPYTTVNYIIALQGIYPPRS